jgi:3-methyladenine DNA glycosylase Tag
MTSSFEAIRDRAAARKGGMHVLERLLGQGPNVQRLAGLPDHRILSAMAERVFCAGFVWRVIEQKWPGFEEAFLGFEPRTLIFQPDDFWHDLSRDKRIVRNPQKIRAVRDNARFVADIAAEHGSFGRFLAAWPADDQLGLLAVLEKRGARLGGNTGQYLLRFLGRDSFILTNDLMACLRDSGVPLSDKGTSRKDAKLAQNQINAWAAETGLPLTHISRICAMSIGENRPPEQLRQYMQTAEESGES